MQVKHILSDFAKIAKKVSGTFQQLKLKGACFLFVCFFFY